MIAMAKTSAPVRKYKMTLSLNVLNHLGLNLYSSTPAVLSEAVANAWDADATLVDITLDTKKGVIVIADNGVGMDDEEINSKFLRVGYQRREGHDESEQLKKQKTAMGRDVMGRKGIGKLAMFGIADTILVETNKSGVKNALEMNIDKIKEAMGPTNDPEKSQVYQPEERPVSTIDFDQGTRITLSDLRQGITKTSGFLRQRLARRFSIIGEAANFHVFVDTKEIKPDETNLGKLAQYAWIYGDEDYFNNVKKSMPPSARIFRLPTVLRPGGGSLIGWLATAHQPSALKSDEPGESLNRIPIFSRGRVAQEDILNEFLEGGIYKTYVFGEIHAEFLDDGAQPDIATSSRQSLKEDDERYEFLRTWVKEELAKVKSRWSDLRNQDGRDNALEIPAVDEWFKTLDNDHRKRAERLFGKIYQLGLNAVETRNLYCYGVLAFETMSQKGNLDKLNEISAENLTVLGSLLTDAADLEAAMYHRIVTSRLAIIDKLDDLVTDNQAESFIQEHLFKNLWLLDPSWERASLPTMEKRMETAFKAISNKIPADIKKTRYDIRYQKTSGAHVIVELKRADVKLSTMEILDQTEKYRQCLLDYLDSQDKQDEQVMVVCVVGSDLKDWGNRRQKNESTGMLRAKSTRVIKYDQLISDAQAAYSDYLETRGPVGRVQKVLDNIVSEIEPSSA